MPSWNLRFDPETAASSVPLFNAKLLANSVANMDQAAQCLEMMEELDICYRLGDAGFVFPGLLPSLTQVDPAWWGGGLENRKIFGRRLRTTNVRFLPASLPVILHRQLLRLIGRAPDVKQIRLGHFFFALCDCRVLVRFNMLAGSDGVEASSCAQSLDVVVSAATEHVELGAHALDLVLLVVGSVLASTEHFQHLKLEKEVLAGWIDAEHAGHAALQVIKDRWLGRLVRFSAAEVTTEPTSGVRKLLQLVEQNDLRRLQDEAIAGQVEELVEQHQATSVWHALPLMGDMLRTALQTSKHRITDVLSLMTDPLLVSESLVPDDTRPPDLARLLRHGSAAQSLLPTENECHQALHDVLSSPMYAVVFAANNPSIEPLQCPEDNIERLAAILQHTLRVPSDKIICLRNATPAEVTHALRQIGAQCGRHEKDSILPRVILAFAGHGFNGEQHNQPLTLLLKDASHLKLRQEVLEPFVDAIQAESGQPRVRTSVLLLLDACFSGQAGIDVGLDSSIETACRPLPIDTLTVLASSSREKRSREGLQSVFMEPVKRGLQGQAVMPTPVAASGGHGADAQRLSRPITHTTLVAYVEQELLEESRRVAALPVWSDLRYEVPEPCVFRRSARGSLASLVLGDAPARPCTSDELMLRILKLEQSNVSSQSRGHQQREAIHAGVIGIQKALQEDPARQQRQQQQQDDHQQ